MKTRYLYQGQCSAVDNGGGGGGGGQIINFRYSQHLASSSTILQRSMGARQFQISEANGTG